MMVERYVVRLGPKPDIAQWIAPDGVGQVGQVAEGPLTEAAAGAQGCRVLAMVPAAEVLLTRVQVPGRNRQRIRKAVPYALEEQLADDVEALHFALGPQRSQGGVDVAVVKAQRMREWLEPLRRAGLNPQWLVPESLVLPFTEGEWIVWVDAEQCIGRTGLAAGFGIDRDNLEEYLNILMAQSESPPARIRVYVTEDFANFSLSGDLFEVETAAPVQLLDWAKQLDLVQSIDLLQNEFSRSEQIGKALRPWRPAAALLMGWLLVKGLVLYGETLRFEQQAQSLSAEIEALFRNSFPEVRRVVDPRVQMERRLAALRRAPESGTGGIVGMLRTIGTQVQAHGAVELQSLHYRDGRLDLELTLGNLQGLDQLKRSLSARPGLSVEILSATSALERVEARLRIWSERA